MLKDWQSKFPSSFERFPSIFNDLESDEQEDLCQLFSRIERKGLLDDDTVGRLLESSSYLSAVTYLINLIDKLNCFNKSMLHNLFTNQYLPELQDNIETLSAFSLVSFDIVTFLFATRNTQECVDFITRAHKAGVEKASILNYLSQHVSLEGLSRAITLFDLSNFSYKQELTFYIRSIISAIESQQNYVQVREMITTLRAKGGNKIIFDKIKYDVASVIESEDLCSTRKYDDLMSEIEAVLSQPQVNLDTFIEELQNSKGYLEYVASALTRQSFLTSTVLTDKMDIASKKSKTDALSM